MDFSGVLVLTGVLVSDKMLQTSLTMTMVNVSENGDALANDNGGAKMMADVSGVSSPEGP